MPRLPSALRYAWAAPASALGLLLAAPSLLAGRARCDLHSGVLEVTLRRLRGRLPFVAITFGHVVIADCAESQRRLRAHERVHVAQYERLGPLFLVAYPAESALQWLRGARPYVDNRFEREARRLSEPPPGRTP